VREGSATIADSIADDINASFATVANPQLIALGMVADLGAPPDTELGRSLEDEQRNGVVRVANRPVDENSPKLVAARKSGSLEQVIRARREQLQATSRATPSDKPRQPLKEIYDWSEFDDDEIGLIDTSTLTASSAESYSEELDQRMNGGGSYAEAQAWQVEEGEDAESFDIDDNYDDYQSNEE
jgi:hypothetical protein